MQNTIKELTVYVTSKCNLMCQQCVMRNFMNSNKYYEMSIAELKMFIEITEKSKYVFDIIICGGEPLLWKYLDEGLKLIRNSSISNKILIFSNVVNIDIINDSIMQSITQLRISRYNCNQVNINKLMSYYPDKIRVVERREFFKLPIYSLDNVLPQECLTPECFFMENKVFACPHSASVNYGKNKLEDGTKLYVPLQINYLRYIKDILEKQTSLCAKCISNSKVRNRIKLFNKSDGIKIL